MGVYDTLHGKVKCSKCKKIFEAEVQVKWTNGWFEDIKIGEEIKSDYPDGECNYHGFMDKELNENDKKEQYRLYDTCPFCEEKVFIKAIIEKSILKDLVSVTELGEIII